MFDRLKQGVDGLKDELAKEIENWPLHTSHLAVWVTVSAACRTMLRSPPVQPAT